MLRFHFPVATLALILGVGIASPSFALGNNLSITNGKEEFTIQKGLFGSKKKVVKDRFGDKYVSKKGWFGTSESGATVLGNGYTRKKGLFGTTEVTGSTILGDSIKTKKGLFGRRTTQVDVSGVTGLVQNLMSSKKNGTGFNIPGLGSFGQGNSAGAAGSMNANANGNAGSTVPPNFDLNNFDLNKGLPQDFGQAPGAPMAPMDSSSLPEVPPRVPDGNP